MNCTLCGETDPTPGGMCGIGGRHPDAGKGFAMKNRRVTRSRSLGFNTGTGNEVRWMPGTFAAGVYEVWCRGDRIAIVTDRWMADMIHAGLDEEESA